MSGQDGHGEQFDTTCSLISAPQWHHTSHSAWTVMDLHGQINAVRESRPAWSSLALSLVCLDSARVWLSCIS